MTPTSTRCLVLACGNPLRGDDGAGPYLAAWAQDRFRAEPTLRILACHQWTPELAEDIAQAESVLFIDCSIQSPPGAVTLAPVRAAVETIVPATHHLGAAELLALARELYQSQPRQALLLTIGAGSFDLGETFSASVQAALPEAAALLEKTILQSLV
jgi:hydrogenase maturation protease